MSTPGPIYCVRMRARPAPSLDDPSWAGAYVNCYVAYPDSRGAEVLARWRVADMGWIPECLLTMFVAEEADNDETYAGYLEEARRDGSCVVIHGWPAGADDEEDEDDTGSWTPPGLDEREMAALAGSYRDTATGSQALQLRTDRHFVVGAEPGTYDGTWHLGAEGLTLSWFPRGGERKARIEGPWKVLEDALVGPTRTLRRAHD